MQSEKDGVEVDQGIFLSHVLANADTGMHLCHAMLLPKMESIERAREFVLNDVIDFGPAKVERQGKAAVVTIKNPRFLNAEDDDTLDDTETAVDIAIFDPMSEICVLRGDYVDHPKYKGRKIFSSGINLTHLYRGKIPYLWYIRRDMGIVNKMFRGLAMFGTQSRRDGWRHARKALGRRRRCLRHRRRLPVSAGDGLCRRRQRRLHDAAGAQGGHHSRRRQLAAAALRRRAHRAAGDSDGPPAATAIRPKAA